jgi:predicted ribosomally synthesized peptide with SipW-like signal peptide
MKRIALSLMTIAAVVVVAVGATSAYYSDSKVIKGNTFSTGSVMLGSVSGMPVTVTGLTPGKSITKPVGFQYTGSMKADIYIGNRGNQAPEFTDDDYLADVLRVKIVDTADSSVKFNGYAKGLAESWRGIASDMSAGWKWYDVTFTLDADAGNEFQNNQNLGTEFLLYAVQTGYPKPDIIPYCVVGDSGDPELWERIAIPECQ